MPFCAWLVSHNIMCSIHVSCHVTEFSSFSIWVEYILSPFMCWWTCSWFLCLMYSTWEYSYILNIMVSCSNIYLVLELINPMQVLCYVFRGNFILLSKLSDLIYISRDYCTYEHLTILRLFDSSYSIRWKVIHYFCFICVSSLIISKMFSYVDHLYIFYWEMSIWVLFLF